MTLNGRKISMTRELAAALLGVAIEATSAKRFADDPAERARERQEFSAWAAKQVFLHTPRAADLEPNRTTSPQSTRSAAFCPEHIGGADL